MAPKIAGASVKMETVGERHWPWAVAAAVVATVAIVTAGALYVFHSARRLPTDVLESGHQALRELRDVAAAFRTGTVSTTFRSDATRLRGTTRLQFVELKQLETFERRDSESLLWGALTLPDVVVEARAPISYEYYVDLEKEWRFRLEGRDVFVVAPPVEWSPPAVDVSALRYEVKAGSVLRDEQSGQGPAAVGAHGPCPDPRPPARLPGARGRPAQGRGVRRDVARPALRRRRPIPRPRALRGRAARADPAGAEAVAAGGVARNAYWVAKPCSVVPSP